MLMRKSLLVLGVCAALTIVAVAAQGNGKQPAQPITVGEFAVMVSQAMGTPATSPQTAIANLQARGLNIPLDLSARLTERQAVSMFHDLGVVNIRTSNPANHVSPDRAETILGAVNLSALSASVTPANGIPDDVLLCVQRSANRGICVECCKLAVGPIPNPDPDTDPDNPDDPNPFIDGGKVCSKFCKGVLPPGLQSPSEPEP